MEIEGIDYMIVHLEKLNPNGSCSGCSKAKFNGKYGACGSCENIPKQKIPMSEYLKLTKP